MRVTAALCRDYDRRLRSLVLRNRVKMVSTKNSGEASCLREMNDLLECMEANDFKDANCATQRAAFLACGRERIHLKETKQLNKTEGKLTSKEINEMLRTRYTDL